MFALVHDAFFEINQQATAFTLFRNFSHNSLSGHRPWVPDINIHLATTMTKNLECRFEQSPENRPSPKSRNEKDNNDIEDQFM